MAPTQEEKFSTLLNSGLEHVKTGKRINWEELYEDLREHLVDFAGKNNKKNLGSVAVSLSSHTLESWRLRGVLPHEDYRDDMGEAFVRYVAENGFLRKDWADKLLASIRHPEKERILKDCFPGAIESSLPETTLDLRSDKRRWISNAPPDPDMMFIGRDKELGELLELVFRTGMAAPMTAVTAIHGWPGIGKTTLALKLVHDQRIQEQFEGVLWAKLGKRRILDQERSDFDSQLVGWITTLSPNERLADYPNIEDKQRRLKQLLGGRRILLVLDDVWQAEHILPFKVGGPECSMLLTTRMPRVIDRLNISNVITYPLDVLARDDAVSLLIQLAPDAIQTADDQAKTRELAEELGRLPLALQVAGPMIKRYCGVGKGVGDLLRDLRDDAKRIVIVKEQSPSDIALYLDEMQAPTVAALLKRSTDCLDEKTRYCFITLGALAAKPAQFDMDHVHWLYEDMWVPFGIEEEPIEIIMRLHWHGLLECLGGNLFQIHYLLQVHAEYLDRLGNSP